jgi:hypothetical protein
VVNEESAFNSLNMSDHRWFQMQPPLGWESRIAPDFQVLNARSCIDECVPLESFKVEQLPDWRPSALQAPRSSVNREAGMLPAFNFVVTIGPDELAAFISGM